jgi:hypothetical protein
MNLALLGIVMAPIGSFFKAWTLAHTINAPIEFNLLAAVAAAPFVSVKLISLFLSFGLWAGLFSKRLGLVRQSASSSIANSQRRLLSKEVYHVLLFRACSLRREHPNFCQTHRQ